MSIVRITIDGKEIAVSKDSSVMEAASRLGIKIPALCYDPTLEVVGACRMCIVEIEGSRGLKTACSTKVWDGMVVHTESEKVVEMRREILRLYLDNHPNDCLTCDKAGDCLLQEYAYRYGVKFREHDGDYKESIVDTTSPYILKDESKCILCGKCVRTCDQIFDRKVLTFAGRGFETKIALDTDVKFEESTCVSCNRCVTVCPVGALLDKRAMGKMRPWRGTVKGIKCNSCDYGCNFEVLIQNGKNVAIRAKGPTEGRPLCLKGRLLTELKYVENPEKPFKKLAKEFVETTWEEALGLDEILGKLDR